MKKIFSLIIVLAMLCTVFTGLGLGVYGDDEKQIYEDGGFDKYSGVEQLPEWLAGPAPSYNEYGLATISGDFISSNPGFYVVSPTNNYGQLVGGGVAPGGTVNREFSNMFISVDEEIIKEESGQYIFEMDIDLPLSSFGDGMYGLIRTGKTPESSANVDLNAVMPGIEIYTSKAEFENVITNKNKEPDENGFYHITLDITNGLASKVDCIAIYHRNYGANLQASIDNVKITYKPTEGDSTVLFNYDFEDCKAINDVGIGIEPNNGSFSGSVSYPIIKNESGDSYLHLSYNKDIVEGNDGKSELVKSLNTEALKEYGVGQYEISFDVRTNDKTFDYDPPEDEDPAVSATKDANFKLFLADSNFELAMEIPAFSKASGYKGLVTSDKEGWKAFSAKVYLSQYYVQRMSQIVFSLTTGSREGVYVDIDNVSIVKIAGSGELKESPSAPENSTFYDMVKGGTFEDFAVGNLTNEPQNGWSVNVSDAVINGKIAADEEGGNKFMRLDCTEKLSTGLVAEALVQLDTSLWKVGRVYKISYDFRITGAETSLNWIQKYLPSGAHVSFYSSSQQEYYQQVLLPNGAYDMNANLITSGNAYPITVTDSTLEGWKHLEFTFEIDENFKNQVDCIEFILANPLVLGGQPEDATLALDFDNFTFGFYRLEGEEINTGNSNGNTNTNKKKSGCGSATYGSLLSVAVLAAGFATVALVRKAKKGE